MEKFRCPNYPLSDVISLKPGSIRCRSCLQFSNETNISSSCCGILPVSNADCGIPDFKTICNDCGQSFGSHSHYQRHKKKESCSLLKYGCKQQTDLCSVDKHLLDKNHTRALEIYIIENLRSLNDLNLSKYLTEYVSENINNLSNDTIINNDSESIDERLLVLDFDAAIITQSIEKMDNSPMTNLEIKDSSNIQLNCIYQIENLIPSRLDESDEQQYNISISEEQIQELITENELQERPINKLQKQVKQLSIEIEQLSLSNEILNNHINTFDIELLSKPLSQNGVFIWLLNNMAQEIQDSLSRKKPFIDSPRFLSLTGEHPLNARLFLHGDPTDYPKYISIHVKLSSGGNNNLCIPITCCLVDQTNNHQHIIKQDRVNLNRDNIGTIFRFLRFVEAIDVHKEGSSFVKNDTLCLIIKLHEDELNQYEHHSPSIQNALQQIDSLLTVS